MVPTPAAVARWGTALAGEVARLPVTLARARRLLVDLPEELDRLIVALQGVEAKLEHLDRLERLDHLDTTLTAALGSIPGLRRTLRPGP